MEDLDKNFYVEPSMMKLAGPYDFNSAKERRFFNRACFQLKIDPSIVWEVRQEEGGHCIYRTNMLVNKRLKYD